MKKIGLISDIHANLEALQRSLAIFSKHAVDQVLCAGDLVEKGPSGDAVVALIRTMAIPCVMGNHDFDAISNQAWLRANADLSHPAMEGRLLNDETLSFLAALPKALSFTWENRHVFLAHGAPWSTNEYIFPTSPPRFFQRIADETQADVVVLGHTHIPMCIQVNQTRMINPGALSGNYPENDGTCAVLNLPEGVIQWYSITSGLLVRTYPE
jgi:putative phosphoesterase